MQVIYVRLNEPQIDRVPLAEASHFLMQFV